jgi:hypothetical protein
MFLGIRIVENVRTMHILEAPHTSAYASIRQNTLAYVSIWC